MSDKRRDSIPLSTNNQPAELRSNGYAPKGLLVLHDKEKGTLDISIHLTRLWALAFLFFISSVVVLWFGVTQYCSGRSLFAAGQFDFRYYMRGGKGIVIGMFCVAVGLGLLVVSICFPFTRRHLVMDPYEFRISTVLFGRLISQVGGDVASIHGFDCCEFPDPAKGNCLFATPKHRLRWQVNMQAGGAHYENLLNIGGHCTLGDFREAEARWLVALLEQHIQHAQPQGSSV